MRPLALITALLVTMAQPLAAQKLGLLTKELQINFKLAEAGILNNCKLPEDLKKIVRRNNAARLTKIANKWIDNCNGILKEKGLNNKATDYYLGLARSLTPTIRTLTQKDLGEYAEALEALKNRTSQN